MRSPLVYPTRSCTFRFFLVSFGLLLLALAACSGSKHKSVSTTPTSTKNKGGDEDGGPELDANIPLPTGPNVDAAALLPGDPPPQLAGQACAIDTNKLYTLVTNMRQPDPTQLAVDLVKSRFAVAYVDKSKQCIDAVFLTELTGASGLGMPKVTTAIDACTIVDHVAVAYNGDAWLLGSIDARMDERDLWLQGSKPGSSDVFDPHRITMNTSVKSHVALASLGPDSAVAAWVEQDMGTGHKKVNVRLVSAQGDPKADTVVIDESDTMSFAGLALAPIGKSFFGLGYRRFDASGHSEILLQVLDPATGKPDRAAWVLTPDGGAFGSLDISADQDGGGVIYSVVQGESEQLWFQRIDQTGHAAPVMSGGKTGGPSDPLRVVGPPYNAVDASLTKLPVGFVVAYRALPGGALHDPRIRVQFLDRVGNVAADSDVALAQQSGGRTSIQAAYDGRIVLTWSDQTPDGKTSIVAAKLPCVGGI